MISILLRISQTAGEMKARHVAFAANSRNQHRHARIGILKIKEQHDAPVGLGIAMDEPVFAQIRNERAFLFHNAPQGF